MRKFTIYIPLEFFYFIIEKYNKEKRFLYYAFIFLMSLLDNEQLKIYGN